MNPEKPQEAETKMLARAKKAWDLNLRRLAEKFGIGFANISLVTGFQRNFLVLLVLLIASTLAMLSIELSTSSDLLHNFELYAVIRRSMRSLGLEAFSYADSGNIELPMAITIAVLFPLSMVFVLLILRYRDKTDNYPTIVITLKIIVACHFVSCFVWVIPNTALAATAMASGKFWLVLLGLLLFGIISFELTTVVFFTCDTQYVKRNRTQGFSYNYFILRTIGCMIITIFTLVARKSRNYGGIVVAQLMHLLLACCLLTLQYVQLTFTCFSFRESLFPFFDVIYLWHSFSTLIAISHPPTFQALDMRFTSYFAIPFLLVLFRHLLYMRVQNLRITPMMQIKSSNEGRLYLQHLYKSFLHRQSPMEQLNLSLTLSRHIKTCNIPFCMCFYLKKYFLGSANKRTAQPSIMNMHLKAINRIKGRNDIETEERVNTEHDNFNFVTIFRDENTIQNLKLKYLKASKPTFWKSFDSIRRVDGFMSTLEDERVMGYYLDLNSSATMTRAMCSFLVTVTKNLQGDIFDFFGDKVAFFMYEYQNYVATLVSLYNFIHSTPFMKTRTAFRDFYLRSYLAVAKKKLDNVVQDKSQKFLKNVEFAKIFEYRDSIASLRAKIKDLMLKKVDLYLWLAQQEIDLEEVLTLGETIHKEIKVVGKEIERLSAINLKNIRLVKERMTYEICLVEKRQLTSATKNAFIETCAEAEVHYNMGSMNTNNGIRRRFNFYNSSNVVVFANCLSQSIKITKFTNNACDLFCATKEQLMGAETKMFMPTCISIVHDNLIMNYLNGNSLGRKKGSIYSVLKTYTGNYKSVVVIPKLEYMFSDDIYIGAVIISRKKNSFPLLYTDVNGVIVGANTSFMAVLDGANLDQYCLFTMLPRLFTFYYPKLDDAGKDSELPDAISLLRIQSNRDNKTDLFECFLFRMLSKHFEDILKFIQNERLSFYEENNRATEVKKIWSRIRRIVYSSRHHTNNMKYLACAIVSQAELISNHIDSLLKVTMSIECHRYQMNLELRELYFTGMQTCGAETREFFKHFSNMKYPNLLKLMSLTPQTIKSIFRLCEQECKIKRLQTMRLKNDEPKFRFDTESPSPTKKPIIICSPVQPPQLQVPGIESEVDDDKKSVQILSVITEEIVEETPANKKEPSTSVKGRGESSKKVSNMFFSQKVITTKTNTAKESSESKQGSQKVQGSDTSKDRSKDGESGPARSSKLKIAADSRKGYNKSPQVARASSDGESKRANRKLNPDSNNGLEGSRKQTDEELEAQDETEVFYHGNYMGPRLPVDFFYLHVKPAQADLQIIPEDNETIKSEVEKTRKQRYTFKMRKLSTKGSLKQKSSGMLEGTPSIAGEINAVEETPTLGYLSTPTQGGRTSQTSFTQNQSQSKGLLSRKEASSHAYTDRISPNGSCASEIETKAIITLNIISKDLEQQTLSLIVNDLLAYIRQINGVESNEALWGYFRSLHPTAEKQIPLSISTNRPNLENLKEELKFLQKGRKDARSRRGFRKNTKRIIKENYNANSSDSDSNESNHFNNSSEQIVNEPVKSFHHSQEFEGSSTLIRTHRVERTQNQKLQILKQKIFYKTNHLNYKYFEKLLALILLFTAIITAIIKSSHDDTSSQAYENMISINTLASSLRPSGFYYKQYTLRRMKTSFDPDESNYYDGIMINWLAMNYSLTIMNKNFAFLQFTDKSKNKKWNNDTKRSEEPNGTYNLGTYSLNIQSSLITLIKTTKTKEDLYSSSFDQLWENLRFYSRQLLSISFETVEKGTANITDLLYKVKVYLILASVILVSIMASFVGVVFCINHSIISQTNDAHELLLKLDKHAIQDALIVLNRNVQVRNDDIVAESNLFKEELRSKMNKLKNMTSNTIYVESSNKTSKSRRQIKVMADKVSQGRRSYNHPTITIFIKKVFETTGFWNRNIVIFLLWILCIALTTGSSFAYLVLTYNNMKTQLNDLALLSIVGSMYHLQGGLVFKALHEKATGTVDNMTEEDSMVMTRLVNYEKLSLDPKDGFIREALNIPNMCERYKGLFPASHLTICKNMCGLHSNYSLYEGLHRLFTGYYEAIIKMPEADTNYVKEYIESRQTAQNEMLSFYLVISIRAFTVEFAQYIDKNMKDRAFNSEILTYAFLVEMVIGYLLYYFYWLRFKKRPWYKLVHTLLVLNDNVLYNEYIKGYFSIQWKRL